MSKLGILGLVTAPLLAGVGIGYALPRASSAPDTAPKEKPPQAAIDELYLLRERIKERLVEATTIRAGVERHIAAGEPFQDALARAAELGLGCLEMQDELMRRLKVLKERYGFEDPSLNPRSYEESREYDEVSERVRKVVDDLRHRGER